MKGVASHVESGMRRARRIQLLLLVGSLVSAIGSYGTVLAVPFVGAERLGYGALGLALLAMAEYGAIALFAPKAGTLADRHSLRLGFVASVASAAAIGGVVVAYETGTWLPATLPIAVVVVGMCRTFFDAAVQQFVGVSFSGGTLVRVNSSLEFVRVTSQLVGPPALGVVIGAVGVSGGLGIDAATYLVAAVCLTLCGLRTGTVAGHCDQARSAAAPVRALARQYPWLVSISMSSFFLNLGGGVAGGLFFAYAYRELDLTVFAVSVFAAFGGLGGVLGTVLAPRLIAGYGGAKVHLFAVGATAASLFLIPLARFTPRPIVTLCLYNIAFAAPSVVVSVCASTIRQEQTSTNQQGATFGVVRLLSMASAPVGMLIGGIVGHTLGIVPALFLGAAMSAPSVLFARRLERIVGRSQTEQEGSGVPPAEV